VCLSALLWGFITTLSRLAYEGGGTPHLVVLSRFAAFVAFIGLLILVLRRSMRLNRPQFVGSLWMGLTIFGMSFGYLSSVAYIPVSLSAMIFYTYPLQVGLVSSLLGREKMTWTKAGALAGLALAIGPRFSDLDPRGLALAVVASASVATFTTFGGRILGKSDTLVINFYVNLWCLAGFGAFVAVAGNAVAPETALGAAGLGGATACYLLASIAIFAALPMISAVRVVVLSNIEPVVSVAAAAVILGEQLASTQIAGAALVISAIYAVTIGGRRRG
jgi:drug/metabolite transporter (DMT)-like permease